MIGETKNKVNQKRAKNMLKRTYKYRLYPTKTQQEILENHLSVCRWLYNHFLEERKTLYESKKIKISCYNQIKKIPKLKKERLELAKVYSQTLQDVVRRLDKAFQNFFRRVEENKNGKRQKVGYPRFKGKYRYDSFAYPQKGFELKGNRLNLSKMGDLKIRLHRELEGNIKTLTIRRSRTNKWYVCFSVEINPPPNFGGGLRKRESKHIIGIDVGLNSFLTTNNGEKIDNPRYLIKLEEKLSEMQKRHSKKKLGSSNREKSRLKIAKIHEKITNQRLDSLHKLANNFVKSYDLIAFEKLNIKRMIKNSYLAKSIVDVSWNTFLQLLRYKAEEAGVSVVEVNPKNTSRICSGCGNIAVKKALSTTIYQCPKCGLIMDRDKNAARNILNLALNTVGTTGINACGVEGLLSTIKQETLRPLRKVVHNPL